MARTQWSYIYFLRGYDAFCNAWRDHADASLRNGDVMRFNGRSATTNMSVRAIHDFRRRHAPESKIAIYAINPPDDV